MGRAWKQLLSQYYYYFLLSPAQTHSSLLCHERILAGPSVAPAPSPLVPRNQVHQYDHNSYLKCWEASRQVYCPHHHYPSPGTLSFPERQPKDKHLSWVSREGLQGPVQQSPPSTPLPLLLVPASQHPTCSFLSQYWPVQIIIGTFKKKKCCYKPWGIYLSVPLYIKNLICESLEFDSI